MPPLHHIISIEMLLLVELVGCFDQAKGGLTPREILNEGGKNLTRIRIIIFLISCFVANYVALILISFKQANKKLMNIFSYYF